ncbi:MAG: flagellar basal body L-ring protein FlgH [Gammaproteobacteria bacterium]|nr:flagellar basal body L-ring protein FlgH [Gammaproteobacteria bacterium]
MKAYRTILVLLALTALLLSGCASAPRTEGPSYRPVHPPMVQAPPTDNGSIYQSGYEVRLFEDNKARRVGDVLTITLQERTQASKSASTETTKSSDVNIANPTLFGASPQFNVPGVVPLDSNRGNSLETGISSGTSFAGEGDASQSNSLTGNITVTIADVLPNGNLVVRGEKWLTLNNGEEFIQISGIVRPQDISTGNTVASTQVADARITYSGKGQLADTQRSGWLTRFFNSAIWPL